MDAALTDLGEGIVRVTLPLPWALDHVHCYAVADPGGWTLVDAGLGSNRTLAAWDEALAELGSPPVRRVLITHYHPDHLGAPPGSPRQPARPGRPGSLRRPAVRAGLG